MLQFHFKREFCIWQNFGISLPFFPGASSGSRSSELSPFLYCHGCSVPSSDSFASSRWKTPISNFYHPLCGGFNISIQNGLLLPWVSCRTAVNNFLLGKLGSISTFKNRCLYVLMNHNPSPPPIQKVFPRDLTPTFLLSSWHLLDSLLDLWNAYVQRCGDRLVRGFLLPPSVTFFKKMIPSNLCSARNETKPWLCRNLIVSSLESCPGPASWGPRHGDLPARTVLALSTYVQMCIWKQGVVGRRTFEDWQRKGAACVDFNPVLKLRQPPLRHRVCSGFQQDWPPSSALLCKAPLPTASLNEKQLISKLRNLTVIQGSAWLYYLKT